MAEKKTLLGPQKGSLYQKAEVTVNGLYRSSPPVTGRACPWSTRSGCCEEDGGEVRLERRSGRPRGQTLVITRSRWKRKILENPPTSGIVRHDSYLRKSEVNRPGIEPVTKRRRSPCYADLYRARCLIFSSLFTDGSFCNDLRKAGCPPHLRPDHSITSRYTLLKDVHGKIYRQLGATYNLFAVTTTHSKIQASLEAGRGSNSTTPPATQSNGCPRVKQTFEVGSDVVGWIGVVYHSVQFLTLYHILQSLCSVLITAGGGEEKREPELPDLICTVQRYDGNTVRLACRSDEALGVRVSVARIAPSLLDLGCGVSWNAGVPRGNTRQISRLRKLHVTRAGVEPGSLQQEAIDLITVPSPPLPTNTGVKQPLFERAPGAHAKEMASLTNNIYSVSVYFSTLWLDITQATSAIYIEYGAALEWKGGVNGRPPRKHTDQQHHPAQFPHAKIRDQPRRKWNPAPLTFRCLVSTFDAEKLGSHKGENATYIKCAVAAIRKALYCRAMFSSQIFGVPLLRTHASPASFRMPITETVYGIMDSNPAQALYDILSMPLIPNAILLPVSVLACHQGEQGSIPCRVTGYSQVGIVPDNAVGRRVFSGISHFPTLSFQRRSIFASINLIGFQDLAVKNRPNLSILYIQSNNMHGLPSDQARPGDGCLGTPDVTRNLLETCRLTSGSEPTVMRTYCRLQPFGTYPWGVKRKQTALFRSDIRNDSGSPKHWFPYIFKNGDSRIGSAATEYLIIQKRRKQLMLRTTAAHARKMASLASKRLFKEPVSLELFSTLRRRRYAQGSELVCSAFALLRLPMALYKRFVCMKRRRILEAEFSIHISVISFFARAGRERQSARRASGHIVLQCATACRMQNKECVNGGSISFLSARSFL
ncbi:hypothetical protein PR048_021478 [Dryococelus australis]|uniref:Uncharacterized protein n=1 Tax=Dryococelus australis TaxID=614101 RepID=A0ABQ9GYH8_9NEOP|nr:hypothetical protein PR048_021478 [Dryococelus australis]